MGTMPYANAQAIFQQQFDSVRRDEVVGVLLAFFLGCFGIHHFYVGRVGLGILYCCFCWTGIPAILGVIECFFMPGRVRMYNAVQAAGLAASLGIGVPGYVAYPGWVAPGYGPGFGPGLGFEPSAGNGETTLVACGGCGTPNAAGSRYCSGCGRGLV